jgi:hypothetical protein
MSIIGEFEIFRIASDEIIKGQICSDKKDQETDNNVFFKDIPLVSEMVDAHLKGSDNFTAGKYDYYIRFIDSEVLLIRSREEEVFLDETKIIHIVTAGSFTGVTTHCPNCETEDNTKLKFLKARVRSQSSRKKRIILPGVLHCGNCDFYYINKSSFYLLPKKLRKDLGVQTLEIKINKAGNIEHDSQWKGAPDSILSRNGYVADGTLSDRKRREVIKYIIEQNIGSLYDVQTHLTWLIGIRSKRNPHAAEIWKSDISWMQDEYREQVTITAKLKDN